MSCQSVSLSVYTVMWFYFMFSRWDPAKPCSHVLSVCLSCLSVCLFVCLSVCLFRLLCDSISCSLGETLLSPVVMCCLSVCQSVCLSRLLCDCILCYLGETLLSPLVMCGPHGLKFLQAVELRLPHCASVNPDSWSFALKSSDSPTGKGPTSLLPPPPLPSSLAYWLATNFLPFSVFWPLPNIIKSCEFCLNSGIVGQLIS